MTRRVGCAYFRLGAIAFALDADGAVSDAILDVEAERAEDALLRRLDGAGPRDWPGRLACELAVADVLDRGWQHHGIALAPRGSALELAVWRVVGAIPFARTMTYKAVAEALPADVRAPLVEGPGFSGGGVAPDQRDVALALAAVPIEGLIPCHRVARADGRPAGSGRSADLRRAMLEVELWSERSRLGREGARLRRESKDGGGR